MLEQIDADQPTMFSDVTKRLDRVVAALTPPEEGTFTVGLEPTTHVKMRLKAVLLSADHVGACAITLKIGTRSFVYEVVGPLTLVVFPPVTIIDRGVDVTCTADAGNVTLAQLRYTAE